MINKLVNNTKRELTIDYISKVVSDYFCIPVDSLAVKTRKREIVQARQIAMYFPKILPSPLWHQLAHRLEVKIMQQFFMPAEL